MFTKRKKTPLDIDTAIAAVHSKMEEALLNDRDEYSKLNDDLAKLYKMKESLKDPSRHVSKDAIVAAAASVGSVALILIFEGVGRGIITSKSLGFAPKPKNTTPSK